MHVQQAVNAIKQWTWRRLMISLQGPKRTVQGAELSLKISQGDFKGDSVPAKSDKTATEMHKKNTEAVMSVVNQIFLLYSNLLSDEANQSWNKILAEQVDCNPWMDLQG
jgi:hypothetical protein